MVRQRGAPHSGRATTLRFGTPHPRFQPKESYEIVGLDGRLLCIECDDNMGWYEIKLLDRDITLQTVIAHIKEETFQERMLRDLPGIMVAVDGFSPNRYGSWRGRWCNSQLLCFS